MVEFRRRPYTAPCTYKIVLFAPEGICATSNGADEENNSNAEPLQEELS